MNVIILGGKWLLYLNSRVVIVIILEKNCFLWYLGFCKKKLLCLEMLISNLNYVVKRRVFL